MITAELLARMGFTLDDLIKAARREAALRKNSADGFVRSGRWKPEEARLRVAEMEAIVGVLEKLEARPDLRAADGAEPMTCETVRIGGTVAIVCSRGRRRKRCPCGRPATKLCDQPMPHGGTCDAAICDRCAHNVGPDRDLCPAHSSATEQLR